VPFGSGVVVIEGGALIVSCRLTVVDCAVGAVESVTVIDAWLVPGDPDGVPVITPAELMDNPAGKPLALKVYGVVPPVAVTAVL
jgi:hypothetical protein